MRPAPVDVSPVVRPDGVLFNPDLEGWPHDEDLDPGDIVLTWRDMAIVLRAVAKDSDNWLDAQVAERAAEMFERRAT